MEISFTNESDLKTASKDFIFVSYSHKDKQLLEKEQKKYEEFFLNYWIDHELSAGDKWDEKVLDVLDNEHCLGAVLYVSQDYLLSEAAQKEIEYCFKKQEKDHRFTIIVVSCNGRSVLWNICHTFCTLSDLDDKELEAVYPQQRLCTEVQYLKKNILYVRPLQDNDDENTGIFLRGIQDNIPTVVENSSLFIGELQKRYPMHVKDGFSEIELGYFADARVDLGDCLLLNGWNEVEGKQIFKQDHNCYLGAIANWKILSVDQKHLVLLSPKALTFSSLDKLTESLNSHFLLFPQPVQDAIIGQDVFQAEDVDEISKIIGDQFVFSDYAKDRKPQTALPDVFIFKHEKLAAYNIAKKKLGVSISDRDRGYLYIVLILDMNQLIQTEG